jgi:hypothetical protein
MDSISNNNNNNNNSLGQSGAGIQAVENLSLLQEIHTGSGAHPAYYSVAVDCFFSQE